MAEARDVEEAFAWFHAMLAEDPVFMSASQPRNNDSLLRVVRWILARIIAEAPLVHWTSFRVPGEPVWHGAWLATPDVVGQFIYDEDTRQLVCAAVQLSDERTHYMRCTLPEGDTWMSARLVSVMKHQDAGLS